MNKLTTVLTLTSLMATLSSTFTVTPGMADTNSLDPRYVSQAEADGPALTSDEQSLFNAINAARAARGLAPFTLDTSLIEPARYEIMDQVGQDTSGPGVVSRVNGVNSVIPYTAIVADFGADTTGLQNSNFDNFSFIYDTFTVNASYQALTDASGAIAINWSGNSLLGSNLLNDWTTYTVEGGPDIYSPTLTRAAVGTVRNGSNPIYFGNIPYIYWTFLAGTSPAPTPPPVVTPPAPTPPPVITSPAPTPPPVLATAPPVVTPPVVTPPVTPPVVSTQAVYRLYNSSSGQHFYTANADEEANVVANGWTLEGVIGYAPISSSSATTPLYRLYNPNTGEHFYTVSAAERDVVTGYGWNYEGVAYNVYIAAAKGTVPLHRLFYPGAYHFYTTSQGEYASSVAHGWVDEGIIGYLDSKQ